MERGNLFYRKRCMALTNAACGCEFSEQSMVTGTLQNSAPSRIVRYRFNGTGAALSVER
jgi:hypothetical protein